MMRRLAPTTTRAPCSSTQAGHDAQGRAHPHGNTFHSHNHNHACHHMHSHKGGTPQRRCDVWPSIVTLVGDIERGLQTREHDDAHTHTEAMTDDKLTNTRNDTAIWQAVDLDAAASTCRLHLNARVRLRKIGVIFSIRVQHHSTKHWSLELSLHFST